VLWIHGGGWEIGNKGGNSGAKFLAAGGFVTASLSYRLSGEAPFPAAIEDCKCAIRFLRANASKYGIDSGRIGVAGSSAGGHLAELVATADASAGLEGDGGWANVSGRVQAAVSYFGVSDLTAPFPPETQPVITKFLRGTQTQLPALYHRASPIEYVSEDDPPLMLVHGTQDHDVPIDQSVRMADRYRRLGLPVEFIAMENAGHDFSRVGIDPIAPSIEAIHRLTVEFFSRHLSDVPLTSAPARQPVPAAIYTDPAPDPKQPARLTALRIPSHGVSINGLVYQPTGAGPHPTLVICHGLPGNERFADLAQALRRGGWNAVLFNYRGSWGSPGAFEFAQNIEDANAVLSYLRDPANAQLLRVDVDRIVLAGHSMAGWVTVHTAAHDPHLIGAIVISAADVGRQSECPARAST
jgi:acetyl esterase/lipase